MSQTPPHLEPVLDLRDAQALPACRYHDAQKAVSFCASCGVLICESCHRSDEEGLATCPVCLQRQSMQRALERTQRHAEMVELDAVARQRLAQEARPDPKEPAGPAPEQTPGLAARTPAQPPARFDPVPWEDPSQGGVAGRFFSTARMALLVPSVLYQRAEPSAQWLRPLLFGFLCILTGMLMQFLWVFTLGDSEETLKMLQLAEAAEQLKLSINQTKIVVLAMLPIWTVLQLGISVGLVHIAARVVGGKGSFLKSLQLYSWSSASFLLHLIPVLGMFMAPMALVFSQLEGMRALHKLTMGRALLAVIIPLASNMLFGFSMM